MSLLADIKAGLSAHWHTALTVGEFRFVASGGGDGFTVGTRRVQKKLGESRACALAQSEDFVLANCARCGFLGALNDKLRQRGTAQGGRVLEAALKVWRDAGFKACGAGCLGLGHAFLL